MAGRKVHEDRHVEIRDEIEDEILELVFLGPVERQLPEDDATNLWQQPGCSEVHETLVHDRHRVTRLLEKENRVTHVDLVRRADRLLNEREVAADEAASSTTGLGGSGH